VEKYEIKKSAAKTSKSRKPIELKQPEINIVDFRSASDIKVRAYC
jgi:hypothetical protein